MWGELESESEEESEEGMDYFRCVITLIILAVFWYGDLLKSKKLFNNLHNMLYTCFSGSGTIYYTFLHK